MKVELHLLQSFPPSNLNRDDTGAPKDCTFGGVRRARISSQCIKRTIRHSDAFKQALSHTIADRTKRAARKVKNLLVEEYKRDAEAAAALADAALHAVTQKDFGIKKKLPDTLNKMKKALDEFERTEVLYFISPEEIEALAKQLHESWDEKLDKLISAKQEAQKAYNEAGDDADEEVMKALFNAQKALKEVLVKPVLKPFLKEHEEKAGSADLALFGRMLASHPSVNVEAACQVAHAISVDRIAHDYDYYTAVDDLKGAEDEEREAAGEEAEDKGAEMIGAVGFNAPCYYRYHCIDLEQLARNLGTKKNPDYLLAREAVRAFLIAATTVVPSGKQNAFAPQTKPELMLTVVRHNGMPVSLANAFVKPISSNGSGVVPNAVGALNEHWMDMEVMYGDLLSDGRNPAVFVTTPHRAALGEMPANSDHAAEEALPNEEEELTPKAREEKYERQRLQHALRSRWLPSVREVIDNVDRVLKEVTA